MVSGWLVIICVTIRRDNNAINFHRACTRNMYCVMPRTAYVGVAWPREFANMGFARESRNLRARIPHARNPLAGNPHARTQPKNSKDETNNMLPLELNLSNVIKLCVDWKASYVSSYMDCKHWYTTTCRIQWRGSIVSDSKKWNIFQVAR